MNFVNLLAANGMNSWWDGLSGLQQVLFIVACATTLFLIIQIIMLIIGMGGGDDAFDADVASVDVDGINDEGFANITGLKLISFRSVIVFFSIGSWVAYIFCPILPEYAAVIIGVVVGAAAGVGFSYAMNALLKLSYNGNTDARNAAGKIGDVYLTVPPKRSGSGKVTVIVQESLTEFEAVTDYENAIRTGEKVVIESNLSQGLLLVKPLILDQKEIAVDLQESQAKE